MSPATSYVTVVDGIAQLAKTDCTETSWILVDATGIGGPVLDALRAQSTRAIGVTITSGLFTRVDGAKLEVKIPKPILIGYLGEAVRLRQFRVTAPDDEARALQNELTRFRLTPGKHPRFEAAVGHDDLIIATALALLGQRMSNQLSAQPDINNSLEKESNQEVF